MSLYCAQKSIALLTIVGTIAGGHGALPRQNSCSRLRANANAAETIKVQVQDTAPESCPVSKNATTSSLSLPVTLSACHRGGAIDDDQQRKRSYGRDGRPPPRRPLLSSDNGRRGGQISGPRPIGDSRHGAKHGIDYFGDRERRYDSDSISTGNRKSRGNMHHHHSGRDVVNRDTENYASSDNIDHGYGKKKKWFSLKKNEGKATPSNESGRSVGDTSSGFDPQSKGGPIPPPPPPLPPLSNELTYKSSGIDTERTPIHYMFPTAEAAAEERNVADDRIDDEMPIDKSDGVSEAGYHDIPFLDVEEENFYGREGRGTQRTSENYDGEEYRASPRRDAITRYMSTKRGGVQVRLGSIAVGAALGGFIGKSLFNDPSLVSVAMSIFFLVTGFLRNDYGELSRALGLAFVLTFQRTRSVRKEYPTLPHLKAMIRQGPRKPFPPVDEGISPWKYAPIYRGDPEFTMTYAVLAMALVGSFCGGNVPSLPAWLGGVVGAVGFASMTMGSNARGDLGRSMGMRVVGLAQLVLAINSDLNILGKVGTVSGLIFDKVMIMDRKHRIKDKIVATCKFFYDKVSKAAEEMQDEMRPERR